MKQASFEEFLKATQTTSFIIIKDSSILYEGYGSGYRRDSIVASFSIAKSFTSALIGIAIGEGYIGTVDDPMVSYLILSDSQPPFPDRLVERRLTQRGKRRCLRNSEAELFHRRSKHRLAFWHSHDLASRGAIEILQTQQNPDSRRSCLVGSDI